MTKPTFSAERLRWGRRCLLGVFCCLLLPAAADGHGGVVIDEDQCVLRIGFLTAHFTGYQPELRGGEEFCEDMPEVGESVFVIDYLHDFMREMPVDFRVIRDVEQFGKFAGWEDVSALGDLEPHTVMYLPPEKHADGVLEASHRFERAGGYIGIVTAGHPTEPKEYNAVFFFQVGGSGLGYLPAFVVLVLLVQLGYWAATGTLQRFLKRWLQPLTSR